MNDTIRTHILWKVAREDAPFLLALAATWVWALMRWPAGGPPSPALALVILAFPALAWSNWARMPLQAPHGGKLLAHTSGHRALRTYAGVFFLAIEALFIHHDLSYRSMVAAGWTLPIAGGFFVLFGNMLPRLPHGAPAGWRTRWNVQDASNWYRTQRVAGRSMMAFGVVQIALTPLFQTIPDESPVPLIVWWALLLACVGVPYLASYRWSHADTSST